MAEPYLSFENVEKSFGPVPVVKATSLAIARGSLIVFLGPSGCGKTTLLRMINGLVRHDDGGSVLVNGETPRPGPNTGFVFQSFRLLPWRTIRGNVEFNLEVTSMGAAQRRERAQAYLDLVGLSRFAEIGRAHV